MAGSSCRGKKLLQPSFLRTLTRTADKVRAGAWATLWTGILIAAIVLGSRNLQNFDPALVIYTFAIIFATLGRHLPLLRLDTKASNLCVLAARMATVQGKRIDSQLRPSRNTGRNSSACPDISSRNAPGSAGRCIR